MESVTKRKLERILINKIVVTAFGLEKKILKLEELTDGCFNNSYFIQFEDGAKVVLKIAPPSNVKVLRYEKNIMETEVHVLRLLDKRTQIPIPKVIFYDQSHRIIDSDYFFMEYANGISLYRMKEQISSRTYQKISKELGEYAKEIHSVKGSYFGFINRMEKRYDTWYACFYSMIKDLFEDAKDKMVKLPISFHEIEILIKRNEDAFFEVMEPVLVHKDLWDGNVFVDPNTNKITALIDCERAIYAEPLLEAVCCYKNEDQEFMKAFRKERFLTNEEKTRVKLYQFYLSLLIVVETPYREYSDEAFIKRTRNELLEIIGKL